MNASSFRRFQINLVVYTSFTAANWQFISE